MNAPTDQPHVLSALELRGPGALLDDYADLAMARGPRAVSYTALRQRSHQMRDILAYHAVEPVLSWEALRKELKADRQLHLNPRWASQLAYTVGLQSLRDDDQELAVKIFSRISGELRGRPRDRQHLKVYAEMLMDLGRHHDAQDLIKQNPILNELEDDYLWLDTLNPYVPNDCGSLQAWTARFQKRFTQYNLEPPTIAIEDELTPFDTLAAAATADRHGGPMVTVVVTAFEPDHTLLHSVRSITSQSWQNLEIIVVDDGSGPKYDETLIAVTSMDRRVRLLRHQNNRGTYAARNTGLSVAQGEFIAGQDSDDWSHPQRIERQVNVLQKNPELPGVMGRAHTVSEYLVNYRVGLSASRASLASMMFRSSLLSELGGYVESRKGVDSEFVERIEIVTGVSVRELSEPLMLVRTAPQSLSRGDFGPHWRHHARRSLVSAFRRWHEVASSDSLNLSSNGTPFFLPTTFRSTKVVNETYDVVFAGEWRHYGGPTRSMIEEIKVLISEGKRVAILQMSAARFMSRRPGHNCDAIQDMLNEGLVDELMLDDEVTVRLLILRYPPVLQFMSEERARLNVERLVILANQAPSERDGRDIRYYVKVCADNAQEVFGVRALWVPQGPSVREAIEHSLDAAELATFDMPGILDVSEWITDRAAFKSSRPVVGRHSRDNAMKWPEGKDTTERLYPVDGSFEVRIMGGHQAPLKAMARSRVPSTWLSFPKDFVEVRTFLNSIDFFIYFQHTAAYDAFGRAVLEALATGCVAILSDRFRPTFGDAALYAEPEDVRKLVIELYRDPDAYRRQSAQGVAFVERAFGRNRYLSLVEKLLLANDLLGLTL